ncbi:MAG: fibronectin type III domain-containing protein [Gemmatimonadales bacterium]
MKVTPRFTVRAALVIATAGVIGAFGACKDNSAGPTPPPPPPPPPPPTVAAPTGLTATPVSVSKINLAWTDAATNETGFRVDRCSGAACTNFAQVGTNQAANTAAFTDSGLTASTSYSYRVRAFNATDSSAWASTATAVTLAAASAITMIGAGEITSCASAGSMQTAALVKNQITADPNTIVFTVGNNLADTTTATRSYAQCFDQNWGQFKTGMRAALGQMDFVSVGSTDAVYSYFGQPVAPTGYYSFDAGNWHVVVLNTAPWGQGACSYAPNNASNNCSGKPHPEIDWLTDDLSKNTKPCLMAISWERRLYTDGNGAMSRNENMNDVVGLLYNAGVDVLVSAKDKQYERFPKLNIDGAADTKGFAQFIVGTGGRSLDRMHAAAAGNPVAAQFGGAGSGGAPDSWGVIKFTLNDNSYGWEFTPTAAGGFSDKSTTPVACN